MTSNPPSAARDQLPVDPPDASRPEVARLGMWLVCAYELLFFGGVLVAGGVIRHLYPEATAAARAHQSLGIGALSTALLLTGSLAVALAGRATAEGAGPRLRRQLLFAMLFGSAFIGARCLEIAFRTAPALTGGSGATDRREGAARIFLWFFCAATGLHALHLAAGVISLSWIRRRLRRETSITPVMLGLVENAGAYWQTLTICWILLFPSLYVAG